MEALADRNRFGDAEIDLEESGGGKAIPSKIAVATRGWTDAGNGERGAVICEAGGGYTEADAGNERRSGAAADGGARLRSAKVEACVCAGDDVEGPTGRDF